MTLQQLSLYNFRNYDQLSLRFHTPVVAFCGANGVGKTNLLDAIHYLCLTRTYFGRSDTGNLRFGQQGFRIDGLLQVGANQYSVACILRETGKKEMQLNQETYTRFSQHIGRFPVVVVAPDDVVLVTGGSEERRNLLDTIISQFSPEYLQQLILYNKVLQQRNSLLKQMGETGRFDASLLEVLDRQLCAPAQAVFEYRHKFVLDYIPEVQRMYQMISGLREEIRLNYVSSLQHNSMAAILEQNLEKDRYAWRTTGGIHRDDVEFFLHALPFRQVASQGQRKSLLFALKLAEYQVLFSQKGFPPLLLLDDVFEKLDAERMHQLLQWACTRQGQVFLTDTHESRLTDALKALSIPVQVIRLGD